MSRQNALLARALAASELFKQDSLFRNATYLMASTAIMSALGFVFWVFVAHLYHPAEIGTASALISITTLISNLSLLGLNSGLVRFLARSKKQSQDINAAAITVASVTILAATAYILIGSHFGGYINFLDDPRHKIAFIVLMTTVSLNSLTDAVFIANRRGEYHTIGYATFAGVKLILPLLLVPFGAIGIFGSYILAMIASLAISYYLLVRGLGYKLRTRPDWTLLKQMRSYTAHNYVGVVLAGLPSQLMPLYIIDKLGAESVAFFSMAWTMANLLFVIPSAVAQSLLAESSFDPERQSYQLKRTVRLLSMLLTPAVILSIVVSPYLLSIFGPEYRAHGTTIFQILAFMTLFVAITSVGNTILNIERRTWGIVGVQAVTLITTATSAVLLIRFGLTGVGLSFLIGSIAASLTHMWLYLRKRPALTPIAFPSDEHSLLAMLQSYGIHQANFEKLGNGSNNATILVRTASKQYVLRIYRPDSYSDARIKQEIDFMHYLLSQGMPTPVVSENDNHEKLSHITLDGTQWQYLVMEFIPGTHQSSYTPQLLTDMAHQQAKLHLNGMAYAGFAKRRFDAPQKIRARERLLKMLADKGFSHFDYDASNLLTDGDAINGILDFEGMRYGPLVGCVYFTLTRIYDYQQDPSMLTLYLASYQEVRHLRALDKLILGASLATRYKKPSLVRALRS